MYCFLTKIFWLRYCSFLQVYFDNGAQVGWDDDSTSLSICWLIPAVAAQNTRWWCVSVSLRVFQQFTRFLFSLCYIAFWGLVNIRRRTVEFNSHEFNYSNQIRRCGDVWIELNSNQALRFCKQTWIKEKSAWSCEWGVGPLWSTQRFMCTTRITKELISTRTGDHDGDVSETIKLIAQDKRCTWICEVDMISGTSCLTCDFNRFVFGLLSGRGHLLRNYYSRSSAVRNDEAIELWQKRKKFKAKLRIGVAKTLEIRR